MKEIDETHFSIGFCGKEIDSRTLSFCNKLNQPSRNEKFLAASYFVRFCFFM